MDEQTKTRKRYVAQISFSIPDSGTVGVFAESEEHARELLPKILAHARDLTIHDIVEEKYVDLPPQPEQSAPTTPETPKVIN